MTSLRTSWYDGQQLCRRIQWRTSSIDVLKRPPISASLSRHRHASSTAATPVVEAHNKSETTLPHAGQIARGPLGRQAQQKEADREFFADLLSSAATKRDAKAYLNRLKTPQKTKPVSTRAELRERGSYVNLGNLFPDSRAAEQSPVFSQSAPVDAEYQEQETLHVALVKIKDVGQLADKVLLGVAETLAQLNRLSISPCVVVESSSSKTRPALDEEVDKLVAAINEYGNSARRVDNVFSTTSTGLTRVSQRKLLMRPLRRGQIPVVAPIAFNADEQRMSLVPTAAAVLAVTREFAGLNVKLSATEDHQADSAAFREAQKQVSLDRIITIDSAGGIPNEKAADGRHVFLNLEQEYDIVRKRLQTREDFSSQVHLANLDLLQEALQLLPPTSSGFMTTHEEAANPNRASAAAQNASGVGTRKQKNTLVHNILTDKPAYSSSLPMGRLTKMISSSTDPSIPTPSRSSFVKRGMPLTMLPNPFTKPWTACSSHLKLTDPRIDLPKLVHLIEDSFSRPLDTSHYLDRVNDRIAGIILAGDYEGGAILTWETPPNYPDAEPVPYLDKFAVLARSQGAGGVADIVFNAMVRSCFPNGVCWRSRKNNPVNKWYFERSRGTWKLPDTDGVGWTMFWTGNGIEEGGERFKHYEDVCRNVVPSWKDVQKPAD